LFKERGQHLTVFDMEKLIEVGLKGVRLISKDVNVE
jgi:hypothetical protein